MDPCSSSIFSLQKKKQERKKDKEAQEKAARTPFSLRSQNADNT